MHGSLLQTEARFQLLIRQLRKKYVKSPKEKKFVCIIIFVLYLPGVHVPWFETPALKHSFYSNNYVIWQRIWFFLTVTRLVTLSGIFLVFFDILKPIVLLTLHVSSLYKKLVWTRHKTGQYVIFTQQRIVIKFFSLSSYLRIFGFHDMLNLN